MKKSPSILSARLLVCALAMLLTGCASEKSKPIAQRGWIGGEYAQAKPSSFLVAMASSPGVVGGLPKLIRQTQEAAILVTKMETNAPASLAGLRPGDYVVELNHQPVTGLRDFRRIVDRSEPGTALAVKAYRDGQMLEYNLPVGREKYKKEGTLSLAFPTVVHQWDLWPNPGFSLVVVGCEPNPGLRRDLGKDREAYDEEWKAYLGFVELSVGKRVVSQEPSAISMYPAKKNTVQLAARVERAGD